MEAEVSSSQREADAGRPAEREPADGQPDDTGRAPSSDPLGEAASAVFDDLAQGDVHSLERRTAPYKHARRTRMLMRAAGRDPACTPPSELGTCAAIAIGFLFTAAWQITAVVVAARFELGFATHPVTVALVALAVAIMVVVFDWNIVQSHVRQEVGWKTWFIRGVFTLCMILLVSEVVALAIFDSDIRAELNEANAVQATELQQSVDDNSDGQEEHRQAIRELNEAVSAAKARVTELEGDLEDEEKGYTVEAGLGPRWNAVRLDLDEWRQQLATAEAARDDPVTGVPAHEREIAALQSQAVGLPATVAINEEIGPARREALLWNYLIENPSALFLKRIPLFVVLVCLDLFALLLGLAVSSRSRKQHKRWEDEKWDGAKTAHLVRAHILNDAKTMIGNLASDGLTGAAEQRARLARQRRIYQEAEEAAHDRREHESRMRVVDVDGGLAMGSGAGNGSTKAGPQAHGARERDGRRSAPHRDVPRPRGPDGGPSGNGAVGPDHAAGRARWSRVSGQADQEEMPVDVEPEPEEPDRERVGLGLGDDDPAMQTHADVLPFLDKSYDTDVEPVHAVQLLDTEGARNSQRATLLLGVDPHQRYHVIKLFSVSGADDHKLHELSRDAENAQRMTWVSGGLARRPEADSRLAPGYFGTTSVAGHSTVPYLVMPYYPSGSVKEYLKNHPHKRLTLDWCLQVSEEMFRACAELAEHRIVGCDAKLSNFVFERAAFARGLTPEDEAVIGPVFPVDPDGVLPDPEVRMIDLSMVYLRGHDRQEEPTRGSRGTMHWSSPRAMAGTKAGPHELTSLDDAFTVAVNSMYLFTEQEPEFPWYHRVALEDLGGSDRNTEQILRELSTLFHRLTDCRLAGPGADQMLVNGRQWLAERGSTEDQACATAAETIRKIRDVLAPETLHQEFRRLGFVEVGEAADERVSR
jgi:hypothetical protein